jgi:hypothetical protein
MAFISSPRAVVNRPIESFPTGSFIRDTFPGPLQQHFAFLVISRHSGGAFEFLAGFLVPAQFGQQVAADR